MYKLILIVLLIAGGFSSKAQYAGYTQLTELTRFREQFIGATRTTLTIKSDFVQEKNLSMLSEKIVSTGKFWFKRESLVRMEYHKPSQYLMILNKDNVYIKEGQKENTLSTRSNKLFRQISKITVDCVQGTFLDNPDFKTKVYESKTSWLVELSPVTKTLKEFYKTINITVAKKDYTVSAIEMLENSGDNTVIRFINKELNTTISDALFVIK